VAYAPLHGPKTGDPCVYPTPSEVNASSDYARKSIKRALFYADFPG